MKNVITILLLMFCCSIFGQNRIPQNGETIVFYPLNKGNEIAKEEYDCFYSFSQVTAKGEYNFKSKFRFKKNASNVTPSSEIEEYTFLVDKQETISEKDKAYLLLFLTRNEDKEKVILRVPTFFDKKSNAITQSFIKLGYNYDKYSRKLYYCNIVLPFINTDSLDFFKTLYSNKEILYGSKKASEDFKIRIDRNSDFEEIAKNINSTFFKFDYDVSYKCSELNFVNVSNNLIYKQLCAMVKSPNGEPLLLPVTYLVGNTNFYDKRQNGVYYLFDSFFTERSEYVARIFESYNCINIINKYTGKKVYYGLDKEYQYKSSHARKFNALENRINSTNELYILNKGVYECIGFDVFKRYDKDYNTAIPFAVLKDSLGVEFRVPVKTEYFTSHAYPNIFCEDFEKYFVLAELVDSILQERKDLKLRKELEEKEKIHSLTSKYGKVYANFLNGYSDKTIKRFETLAKKYGKANAKLIIERRVKLGWSKDMCRESWGSPNDINTTSGSWGVHEQWVYEVSYEDYYNMSCLYFENGVLTTIQD